MAIFGDITDHINEFRAMRLGHQAVKALQAGNYSASEELNRRALDIMERTFGNIEQTVVCSHNLAHVFLAQDRLSEAVPFFERTLQILDTGADVEQFGSVAQGLADVLRELGRDNEAEQTQALAETRRNAPARTAVKEADAFGPEDPRLVEAPNNLAKLHTEQEQYSEAMDEDEFKEFADFFYRSGSPEKAPEALAYYVTSDPFHERAPYGHLPAHYKFSWIAEGKADVLRGYEDVLGKVGSEGRAFILSLLGAVGGERTQVFLESLITDPAYEDVQANIEEALNRLPEKERVEPLRQEIRGSDDLDLLWTEFTMTGDTQAVRRIIQVLEWRDSLRENLETMNLQPRFYLLGLDTLLKRRRLERLRGLAGIEFDYERKRIETVEDLDCLSALWELQVSGQRFQEITEALPFALSQEEVENHILLKAVAKWSLASNAKQHVLVLEACEEEIARRDVRAKLALLEIAVDARLSQRDYGLTAKWIKEFLRLNPSHRGMNERLFLAESELELDRLMTLSKGSPIMDATLPDPKEAARACANETEEAGSYYSRGIMRDRTDEALNSADYVAV